MNRRHPSAVSPKAAREAPESPADPPHRFRPTAPAVARVAPHPDAEPSGAGAPKHEERIALLLQRARSPGLNPLIEVLRKPRAGPLAELTSTGLGGDLLHATRGDTLVGPAASRPTPVLSLIADSAGRARPKTSRLDHEAPSGQAYRQVNPTDPRGQLPPVTAVSVASPFVGPFFRTSTKVVSHLGLQNLVLWSAPAGTPCRGPRGAALGSSRHRS